MNKKQWIKTIIGLAVAVAVMVVVFLRIWFRSKTPEEQHVSEKQLSLQYWQFHRKTSCFMNDSISQASPTIYHVVYTAILRSLAFMKLLSNPL